MHASAPAVHSTSNPQCACNPRYVVRLQAVSLGGWFLCCLVRAGHKLCMLGYGNMAALVNDPRVSPRAWQRGNDVAAAEGGQWQHQQQEPTHPGATCVVGSGFGVLLALTPVLTAVPYGMTPPVPCAVCMGLT